MDEVSECVRALRFTLVGGRRAEAIERSNGACCRHRSPPFIHDGCRPHLVSACVVWIRPSLFVRNQRTVTVPYVFTWASAGQGENLLFSQEQEHAPWQSRAGRRKVFVDLQSGESAE